MYWRQILAKHLPGQLSSRYAAMACLSRCCELELSLCSLAEAPDCSSYPSEEPYFNSPTENSQACGWIMNRESSLALLPGEGRRKCLRPRRGASPNHTHTPISDFQLQNFLKVSKEGKLETVCKAAPLGSSLTTEEMQT